MTGAAHRVLLVSGAVREGSTNTAVLRTVLSHAPARLSPVLYEGLRELPHFDPDLDRDPLPPAVAALRHALDAAAAVVISTPEYGAAMPGALKNLLEWSMTGDHLVGKPVGLLNISTAPGGAAEAHRSLRAVLAYCHAPVVEAASGSLPVPRQALGPDGLVVDADLLGQLHAMLEGLADAIEASRHSTSTPPSGSGRTSRS